MPLFVVIIAISVFLSAAPSRAEQAAERMAVCHSYATRARADAMEAERLRCGFSGPVWTTNYAAHYNWCIKVEFRHIRYGEEERYFPLDACTKCRPYADAAVNAARTNIERGCNFTGPRWIIDDGAHFGWCMQQMAVERRRGSFQSAALGQETVARRDDLKKCPLQGTFQTDDTTGRTLGKRKKTTGTPPPRGTPSLEGKRNDVCESAEYARLHNMPAAVASALEAKCRAAGGTSSCPENMFRGQDGTCYPVVR